MKSSICHYSNSRFCQAGGLPEISRGLNPQQRVIPPVNRKTPATPEGWQKPKD